MQEKQNKAIFFDRDGCLIIDKHYLSDPALLEYYPDTFNALSRLKKAGYQFFMITNQSGIGRGMFTVEEMHQVHQKMIADFHIKGLEFLKIAFCPHTPKEQCDCRKPQTRLVDEIITEFNIDPLQSFFVGDKLSDAQTGLNTQMQGCLVHKKDPYFPSFDTLNDFADFVLSREETPNS